MTDPIADILDMEPLRSSKASLDQIKAALNSTDDMNALDSSDSVGSTELAQIDEMIESCNLDIFRALDIPGFTAEMDQYADEVKAQSQEIMEHAYGEDPKLFAETAGVAERFKVAELEARKAKVNARIKAIDLMLKERRVSVLEQNISQKNNDPAESAVLVYDRNSLLND